MSIIPIILAAGQGTRMKSATPKVLHPVMGKAMIDYILDEVAKVTSLRPIVVVGHGADQVIRAVEGRADIAVQQEQLGTANAVAAAEKDAKGRAKNVLVAYADMPCLRAETIRRVCDLQQQSAAVFTMLTIIQEDSHGFGRIVRNADGSVAAIVEEAQASPQQLAIKECNVGLYCFQSEWLWESLKHVKLSPKGEYYLTDLVELANRDGKTVQAVVLEDREEALGVNTRVHLSEAEAIMRKRVNIYWMTEGVTMIDPLTTYIDHSVRLERDVTLYPNTWISGETLIRSGSRIGPCALIESSMIGRDCIICRAAVRNRQLEDHTEIIG